MGLNINGHRKQWSHLAEPRIPVFKADFSARASYRRPSILITCPSILITYTLTSGCGQNHECGKHGCVQFCVKFRTCRCILSTSHSFFSCLLPPCSSLLPPLPPPFLPSSHLPTLPPPSPLSSHLLTLPPSSPLPPLSLFLPCTCYSGVQLCSETMS